MTLPLCHSTSTSRALLGMLLAAGIASPAAAQMQPATVVRVTVESGRTFVGVAAQTSNEQTLVLRVGAADAEIRRPIAWSRITDLEADGNKLSVDDVKKLAAQDDGRAAAAPEPETKPGRIVRVYRAPPPPAAEAIPPPQFNRPASLRLDAAASNWDEDVEQDGLVVVLEPLDAGGNLTAVSGTAEVTWYGIRSRDFNLGPYDRGRAPEQLGYWSVPVNQTDLTYRGIILKLPFQVSHPEFDLKVHNYSFVHVRLAVPGEGTFEASLDGIRVRPWSPFRDFLQQQQQMRWLPTETTGRGKNRP